MRIRQNKRRGDPLRAVAYLRVSTGEQQLGPEAQRAAIERWAGGAGITVVSWHADQGVSGGAAIDARPGLVAALAELRVLGAGVLVVAKRDRLARDVYVAATIERAVAQCRASVAAADGVGNGETPADGFMRTILDAAAAYERALIRARTKAALAVLKARGESTGVAPYGFRVAAGGRTLEEDPVEQAVLSEVAALRTSGAPYREVRRSLMERGLTGRTGRPFTLQAIYTMVMRRRESARDSNVRPPAEGDHRRG